ncbi:serine--tRNA ligase [Rickettsiales bacterium]|nr:serine--tRNA ligase [Rickettsiales bacterium]
MHDIKFIRNNPEAFDDAMRKRGVDRSFVKEIADLDAKRREAITRMQQLQSRCREINDLMKIAIGVTTGSAAVSILKKNTYLVLFGLAVGCTAHALKEKKKDIEYEIKETRDNIQKLEQDIQVYLRDIEKELLRWLPNLPAEDVPEGDDEGANEERLRWWPDLDSGSSKYRKSGFSPKPHYEVCGPLIDFKQTAKISGSRFSTLKGDLALLERALCNFMLDKHIQNAEYKFSYISPPLLVKDSAMYGVGQLPKFADDSYSVGDGMRLIPTAEAALVNLAADQILEYKSLPLRFVACTPCFRREAGSAGRDTRGIIRQHQFTKVELVSIVAQEQSADELEIITRAAESVLEALELPYRRVLLCSGDMGFAAGKTYDLEVWMPSQNCYREISSCSNCLDFQARRMKARYRLDGKNYFVHTLNGSALAVGRTLAAILENYQNEDGSITIPKSVVQYMDGKNKIEV